MQSGVPSRQLILAGAVMGVGLGGFFDGIVFHQLLQWHHMLTAEGSHPASTVTGLEVNTTWDGIFHSATWLATVAGLVLLWRLERLYDLRWSSVLAGAVLMGWGSFNLLEGLIDHQLLGIHHVRDDLGGPLGWDIGFLAWGAVFLAAGLLLTRQAPAVTPLEASVAGTGPAGPGRGLGSWPNSGSVRRGRSTR